MDNTWKQIIKDNKNVNGAKQQATKVETNNSNNTKLDPKAISDNPNIGSFMDEKYDSMKWGDQSPSKEQLEQKEKELGRKFEPEESKPIHPYTGTPATSVEAAPDNTTKNVTKTTTVPTPKQPVQKVTLRQKIANLLRKIINK